MQIIASRINDEESTIAVMTCKTKFTNPHMVVMAIKCAIANWAKTDDGKIAIQKSCNDFNFGDLDLVQENESLIECLKAQGIENLVVNVIDAIGDVPFDTVLCPKSYGVDDLWTIEECEKLESINNPTS